MAGDITILANRSDYVDFTLPYTEAGVSLIVPIVDERKSAWIFMRPLEKELWIATGAFFIYTGLVVWILEHRVNKEFRGPPGQQVGMIFWFSFSTLVFAHSKFVFTHTNIQIFKFANLIMDFCRGEVDKQPIEICGGRLGVCSAGSNLELHRKLNINVNRTTTST